MFVIHNHLISKRKPNRIHLQNTALFQDVQYAIPKCSGQDCQHKRIQAANIVETDDEKEDDNEFEEVNIVLVTT